MPPFVRTLSLIDRSWLLVWKFEIFSGLERRSRVFSWRMMLILFCLIKTSSFCIIAEMSLQLLVIRSLAVESLQILMDVKSC